MCVYPEPLPPYARGDLGRSVALTVVQGLLTFILLVVPGIAHADHVKIRIGARHDNLPDEATISVLLTCRDNHLPVEYEVRQHSLGCRSKRLAFLGSVNAYQAHSTQFHGWTQQVDSVPVNNADDAPRIVRCPTNPVQKKDQKGYRFKRCSHSLAPKSRVHNARKPCS